MRSDPPLSVRQRKLMDVRPQVETTRQRTVIEMSDRMVKGFKKNAQRIAKKQGLPYDRAAAILAAASRRASAAAIRKNPKLKRVKGNSQS